MTENDLRPAQRRATAMEKCSTQGLYVGVDFHKETTVVTRLRANGTREGQVEFYPSTHEGLARLRVSCGAEDHLP